MHKILYKLNHRFLFCFFPKFVKKCFKNENVGPRIAFASSKIITNFITPRSGVKTHCNELSI